MPCRYNAELSDPRPQKYRDNYGYYNHGNNIVTIFCASSQLDLSFKFIVPNAFNNFTMLETVKKNGTIRIILIMLLFSKNGQNVFLKIEHYYW